MSLFEVYDHSSFELDAKRKRRGSEIWFAAPGSLAWSFDPCISRFRGQLVKGTFAMENIALNAQHSGAVNHIHSFQFNSSVVDALKEVRLGITVLVVGWVTVVGIRGLQGSFMRDRGR